MQKPSRFDLRQRELDRQRKSAATSAKARAREREEGYARVSLKVPAVHKDLAVSVFKGVAIILDGERNGELDPDQMEVEAVRLVRRILMKYV